MKTDIIFLYTTYPDLRTANEIAKALIEANLIGCANLLPQMTSLYRWEGKIEQSQEIVGILKTQKALYKACEDKIKQMHPYSIPCIAMIELDHCVEPYQQWLMKETTQS